MLPLVFLRYALEIPFSREARIELLPRRPASVTPFPPHLKSASKSSLPAGEGTTMAAAAASAGACCASA